MVLLSGKCKGKDSKQFMKKIIEPYLGQRYTELKENILCIPRGLDPCYKQMAHISDTIPLPEGDLSYQFLHTNS